MINKKILIRKFQNKQQIIFDNSQYITLPLHFHFSLLNNQIHLDSPLNLKSTKSLKGTVISNIQQILGGPFHRKLILDGVGYKVELIDNQIKCSIGFSHPVLFPIPKNIEIAILNNKEIHGSSDSLQKLTQFFNKILQTKPAYKDKYKK